MSSYLNTLFNTTASRVASIKQNLLPSENDGDTEDDTHICRVLRGYYTEKGRAFPAWLPPDPRAPPPVVVQPVYTQSNVGRGYGGMNQGEAGGSSLSSLWDSQPQQQGQQSMDTGSLRQGRGGTPAPGGRLAPARHNPFAKQQSTQELQVQARPLPSQRAGSYQTVGASPFGRPESAGAGVAISAKDKLKGQFGQRRAGSPALSSSGSTGAPAEPNYGRNDSYGSSSGGNAYGGSGARGGEKPFVAANSPWATNESEFGGGGYNGGYEPPRSSGGRQPPSSLVPGAGRRGPGLPSGPRGPRNG